MKTGIALKNYYRVMLGRKSIHAPECFAGNFIGVGFGAKQDLSNQLSDDWRVFKKTFIPAYLATRPEKSKIAAGLASGVVWTVCKGIVQGDIVLCPDGSGRYRVGEVTGDYQYVPGDVLPHRRPVQWSSQFIDRVDMSDALRNSSGSIGTVAEVSRHRDEIEKLLGEHTEPVLVSTDPAVEDPSAFALEKHLEDFLVKNWSNTELGKIYDIYEEDGERVGQQYPTDTGPLDILAVSKDKKTLLVVELKKGRASDTVVGQILRYMGYVHEDLAENDQTVRGAIIALEDDPKIRRALAVSPNIDFYRYRISFSLIKA